MFNLLKVELYKLRMYKFGYIAVIFMFVLGYAYGDSHLSSLPFDITDNTDDIFSATVSDTSLVFFIAIFVALFMGKDFSNRTICNEIKLGYNRFHILLSRMVVVCAFAALMHITYIVSTIIGFCVVRGFDTSVFCAENALWLLVVLIQLTAVISGVVLITFVVKKQSGAIALATLYTFICCNNLRNFVTARIFTVSCFYFVQDSSTENLVPAAVSAFLTLMLFSAVAAFTFKKAEVR